MWASDKLPREMVQLRSNCMNRNKAEEVDLGIIRLYEHSNIISSFMMSSQPV